MNLRLRANLLRFGIPFVAVGAMLLARLALSPWLGERAPFLAFTLAVVVTAVFGGFWPAILATTLSLLAALYFVLGPVGAWPELTRATLASIGLFALVGLGTSIIGGLRRHHAALARKEAEALRESRDLLQSVMDGGADPIFVKDSEGRLVFVNEQMCQITGLEGAAPIGRRVTEFLPPGAAARVEQADLRVMRSGQREEVEYEVSEGGIPRLFSAMKTPWRRGEKSPGSLPLRARSPSSATWNRRGRRVRRATRRSSTPQSTPSSSSMSRGRFSR
jgi:PAS domain S-box-containing protein